ncbi:phosphatidylinositide phosphatase SAC2-like [Actinia tenebrosa]|uniref:Phosphatidylinositide phosphatase SAC2-like n=1 Tax=Actinia tenebrosa TaxID=6105 RepID=A0A6P8HF69_ACTTE|nr:phosphatidylinositide phosphatase SAC2-like [Actinia tenebrosa]
MLGNPLTEDLTAAMAALKGGEEEDPWTMEREECVAQLVLHCQWLLLSETDECLGGWALVDPFYSPDGEPNQDQDVILLLTYDDYYVASYDDDAERITQYERIPLEDVEKIEIGFEPSFRTRYLFIRIFYKYQNSSGYFHTLRTIQHRTPEEARGVLLGIADAFNTARSAKSLTLKIIEGKLDKKKSKPPPDVIQISSKSRLSGWSKPKPKAKTQQDLDSSDRDTGKQFKSYLKHPLGGIPRTYSDPCLNNQDVLNNYQAQRKRSGTSSAPLSSASSSSESDSSDDDKPTDQSEELLAMRMHQNRLEMVLQEKLKPARKLECRSEETLMVTKDTDGEKEGQVTKELAVAKFTENEGEGLVAEEKTVAKDTASEEECLVIKESAVAKNTEARVNLGGDNDNGANESTSEVTSEHVTEVECSGSPDTETQAAICNDTSSDQEVQGSKTDASSEGSKTTIELENQLQGGEIPKPIEVNGEVSEGFQTTNNPEETSEKEVDISTGENDIDLDNISEIKESYYESKKKLRNENILGFSMEESMMNLNAQDESEVSPSPTVNLGLGGSFRSMAVSFRSKSSGQDNTETSPAESNGERLPEGEEPSQQGFNRFRFSGRSLGGRPTSTTTSNKTNIFASAQARGRTLLPDLRNKLSSISFPRAKSPRLTHKQPHTVDPDSVHPHRRHKHKHKCLTKIIEL